MYEYAYEIALAEHRRHTDLTEFEDPIRRGLLEFWGAKLEAVAVHEDHFVFRLSQDFRITPSVGGRMGRCLMRRLHRRLDHAVRVSGATRQLFRRMRQVPGHPG